LLTLAAVSDLVREIVVDASPETIFEFFTVPEKHVQWEGTEAELDPRPGGVYRVLIAGAVQAAGEYVEVVPYEKVVFTFGWDVEGNPVGPGSTTVEITLHPDGDKTLVRLAHRGLPDDDAVAQHGHGWEHYLGRLAVAAAGGDAGPDTGPGGA
jgi:uncharacterized protein YndB with AHSA1/START domain